MSVRKYYWNPRGNESCFVDENTYLFAFNKTQEIGTWSDLHTHQAWGELVYVSSGSIVLCTENGDFLAQKHRAVWVPPGLQHEWYMPEACLNRTLFVHPSVLGESSRFMKYQLIEVTHLTRELILAIDDLSLDVTAPEGGRLARVLIDRLLDSKEIGIPLMIPRDHRLVEICAEFLSAPDTPVRLGDWAKRLGVSEKTLSRSFLRQTGQTFRSWLQEIRLQYACTEIKEGRNVTDAAMNCGYSSVSSFITAFKKRFGKTPGIMGKI